MKINGLYGTFKTSYEVMAEQLGLDGLDLSVNFEKAEGMLVGVRDGVGYIVCNEVHHFNRLLALLKEYYKGIDATTINPAAITQHSTLGHVSSER